MATRVHITPLDGIGRVGGSIWHIQQGREGLLIDFGANLERQGHMLGRGLRVRDNRGLDDYFGVGLLPVYDGIYRDDLLLDPKHLDGAVELRVSDVLLTHAHNDHVGNLFALAPELRLHCSGVTAAILHGESVCSKGLSAETTHFVERRPHPSEKGILEKPRGVESTARQFYLTDQAPSGALESLWADAGVEGGLTKSDMTAAGIPYRVHQCDHSIWGGTTYELDTIAGEVVHLSDLRWHGLENELTERLVRHLSRVKPRVLILEGTRLGRENDPRTTELDCFNAAMAAVKSAGKRLVIVGISPRHFERLAIYLAAAQDAGRTLVVSPKAMFLLECIASADEYYDLSRQPGLAIYDPPMSRRPQWHQRLRERFSSRLVSPEKVRSAPRRYVLTHTFGRTVEWLDVDPHRGLYIHSGSAAYSDEDRGRHRTLEAWLAHYNMDALGISFSSKTLKYDPIFNPSGHLHPTDIARLLKRVAPEMVICCHTNNPEAMRDLAPDGTRVILPKNGKGIRL